MPCPFPKKYFIVRTLICSEDGRSPGDLDTYSSQGNARIIEKISVEGNPNLCMYQLNEVKLLQDRMKFRIEIDPVEQVMRLQLMWLPSMSFFLYFSPFINLVIF